MLPTSTCSWSFAFSPGIPHINAIISTLGEGDFIATLDPFITTLNTDLLAEVKAFSGEAEQGLRPPEINRKPQRPPAASPSAKAKVTPVVVGHPRPLDQPCLAHNIKLGLTCPNWKTGLCRFNHLNTNNLENLKKWDQAKAAQDSRSSKGKGKQGKGTRK